MSSSRVITCIENIAPLTGQAEWDCSGIQIHGEYTDVSRIAVTLDPFPAVIQKALEWKADMVVTHHPLSLTPQRLDTPGELLDVTRLILRAGAWLYAAHTSLDVQAQGPAGWLFRALGLSDLSILQPCNTQPDAPACGFGFMGTLPEPLPCEKFMQLLATQVNRTLWTIAGTLPETIRTVAYCTGSGAELAPLAAQAQADIFITGDVKYHLAQQAGICLIDVGHFSLEETMTAELAEQLEAQLGRHSALPAQKRMAIQFFPGTDPFTLFSPARVDKTDRQQ